MPQTIRSLPPKDSTDWYGHYGDLDAATRELQPLLLGKAISVYFNGTLSVGSGSTASIVMSNVDFNDDANYFLFDSGKVTVKIAGLYLVTLRAQYGGNSGPRNTYWTSSSGGTFGEVGIYDNGSGARAAGTAIRRFAANETVGLGAYSGGSASQVQGSTNPKDVGLTVVRLGA